MEYLSLFLMGLSYGSTACMFSCMPFLSPLLLTHTQSPRASLHVVSLFSLGRVVSYALIALAASYGAQAVKSVLDDPALSQGILGASTAGVGLLILYRSFRAKACCGAGGGGTNRLGSIGYFMMGFSISLNLCTPVLSLVALSAGSTGPAEALLMGLTFGTGAVGASWIVFGLFFSSVAREAVMQLSRHRQTIERLAAALLIAVGVATINGLTKL